MKAKACISLVLSIYDHRVSMEATTTNNNNNDIYLKSSIQTSLKN